MYDVADECDELWPPHLAAKTEKKHARPLSIDHASEIAQHVFVDQFFASRDVAVRFR